jgi:EAL domain-containing protein (putative c-di-GMP-specific phosphodiesterase class I)
MGCTAGQGFHWTRPVPAGDLRPWLPVPDAASRERLAGLT